MLVISWYVQSISTKTIGSNRLLGYFRPVQLKLVMHQTIWQVLITAVFCLLVTFLFSQNQSITLPKIGVNGQLGTFDAKNVNYGSPLLVDAINELKLSIVRFPGGTNSNSYNWVAYDWLPDGSRIFKINDDELLFAREGSHLGITTLEEEIGCTVLGSWQEQKVIFQNSLIKTNDLLSDFKTNVLDGQRAEPVYVVRVFDPNYFMGKDINDQLMQSPLFNLTLPGWVPSSVNDACGGDVRCIIKRAALADMRRTLIKIMYEYQQSPPSSVLYDAALNDTKLYKKATLFNLQDLLPIPADDLKVYDKIYFEFGNELYSEAYAKFLPEEGISIAPCLDPDVRTDAILYAEIVADILPFIEEYFPNSRTGVVAGNRRGCSLWTTRVVDALKSIPSVNNASQNAWASIDALTLHFYPKTDSLMNIQNPSMYSIYSYRDQLLTLLANEFESNFEDKALWVTEMGFTATEYVDQRPYIGTWYETLMLLSFIHEIGLRERFVQDYLDQCNCSNKRNALRSSPILPDFKDIEMVLLHTVGVNYADADAEFQGLLRGFDLDGDEIVDQYKISSIGLAALLYRQFLLPQVNTGNIEFKKSLPLFPTPTYVDSLEITRRCALQPKPKDQVYFTGAIGMRAYQAVQDPGRLQDMFVNMTADPINVSSWSLPFMSNGIVDHVWTFKAAGLSEDLLLHMGNLRSDLFSLNPDDVLPAGMQVGLEVTYSNSSSSLIIPPHSVMLVGRTTASGLPVDDHGMSEEAYRSGEESLGIKIFPLTLSQETELTITSEFPGMYSIHDALGRMVSSGTIQEQLRFNTSGLNPGVYLVNVYREGELPSVAKFSVLH